MPAITEHANNASLEPNRHVSMPTCNMQVFMTGALARILTLAPGKPFALQSAVADPHSSCQQYLLQHNT